MADQINAYVIYEWSLSTGALHIDVMSEEGISYYVEGAIEISTWLLHFIYVMTLVERLTPSIRGEFDF